MSQKKPKKKALFERTSARTDTMLNWWGHPRTKFFLYSEAFKKAAQRLLVATPLVPGDDIDACPVVFLYRHALELSLKDIILAGDELKRSAGKPLSDTEKLFKNHDLDGMLSQINQIFAEVGWHRDSVIEDIENAVRELNEVDRGSDAFRYPVNKKGESSISHRFAFDLKKFGYRMDSVLEFLGGASDGLKAAAEACQEGWQHESP
ncbi:MAG TPA: hypothetical protein VGW33_13470 [Terriglobia bacterium]|nr:hypothetical protein [Terriglobia bacterium]